MNAPSTPGQIDETLREIERVLGDEYDALRKMDGSAIADAASKKTALEERLRQFVGKVGQSPELRAAVERIRASAQRNHALIIHARACLRSAIELAVGRSANVATYRQPSGASSHEPTRVNIKG